MVIPVTDYFASNLAPATSKALGGEDMPLSVEAAGCLLQYAQEMQMIALPHIRALSVDNQESYLLLDAASRRNL